MTIEDQIGMPDGSTGGEDLLNSLVGPDKKFKTLSDLAKGKVESDRFISNLSAENAALRALIQNSDDTKRSADVMSEILARVSQGTQTTHQGKTNAGAEPQPNGGEGNQSQALTSRDVEVLFQNLRKKELEDANEARAISSLTKTYGDQQKVDEFLTRRAAELNLDVATLKATARRSPNAFYSLVGITNNNSPTQGNATPGRNTSAIPEVARFGTEAARDKKYYERLKAEMGTKKFMLDKSLQIQLHKDMMSLGERWEQEA